jgi:hypothetical protein
MLEFSRAPAMTSGRTTIFVLAVAAALVIVPACGHRAAPSVEATATPPTGDAGAPGTAIEPTAPATDVVPTPDGTVTGSPPPAMPLAQLCLPVYLEGSCPTGCARVPAVEATAPNARVRACGMEHSVARRRDEAGEEVLFLVPLAPPGTHYVGAMCSARAPDNAMCAGRCDEPCPDEDLGRYFAP